MQSHGRSTGRPPWLCLPFHSGAGYSGHLDSLQNFADVHHKDDNMLFIPKESELASTLEAWGQPVLGRAEDNPRGTRCHTSEVLAYGHSSTFFLK